VSLELLIFDCDGVLFRSDKANIAFYNEVLRLAGEGPLDVPAEAACHALSSAQLFEKYYGDRPEMLERLRATAKALDYGPFYPMMLPHARLHGILQRLRRRYLTALATNRGQTVRGVIEYFALQPLFDLAVGVLDVARPKPHPDMLLKCVEHFGLSPEAALYVGDQPGDAASARAAGVRFVGLGNGVPDVDHRIDDLDELEPLLVCIAAEPLSRSRSSDR
jgi:HAD superfamily hydrolase (TIGR01509 family)